MRRRAAFRRVAIVALAALAAAPRLAAQVPDSVTLRFAWPVGTEARVRYTQLIEREGDRPEPMRMEIEGELAMHVHEHPQGVLVEHLDPLVTRFQASPPLAAGDPHRLIYGRLGTPIPHYVVAADGSLVGVDGVPALADAFRRILGEAAPADALAGLQRELLNEQVLTGNARERWNAMVGLWVDMALREGEEIGAETEESNPLMPSVVLPYVYRFELVGREPCVESEPLGAQCVRLGMISLPDPVQLNQVMTRALTDMGLATMSFDGLAQHTQVELLADPATLLPRELIMSKVVQGILKEGERERVFRRIDGLTLLYTYGEG